jgi:hypothetical protein
VSTAVAAATAGAEALRRYEMETGEAYSGAER